VPVIGADGELPEVHVGGHRLALADLGDEMRAQIVVAILPALLPRIAVPKTTRLVLDAVRALPPDDDTSDGIARRTAFAGAVLALLGAAGSSPEPDALRAAAELLDLVRLPTAAPERRLLEERVWALVGTGRPAAPLRALAERLGLAQKDRATRTAAG